MQFTDDIGNTIHLDGVPKRIVSVVPSQSELLWDLGLKNELVGITKFCIHPHEMYRSVARVGGTKKLHIEKIKELKPDLIIANKEENERSDIEELQKHFPVWISDIKNLDDALRMIHHVGEVVGKMESADRIINWIRSEFNKLKEPRKIRRVLYFIWQDPLMLAGQDTFVNDILQRCGFENLAAGGSRYPELSDAEVKTLKPDLILLSSEPFPFTEKYIPYFKSLAPDAEVRIVDGEMFSWYGSRLIQAPAYLNQLIA